MNFFNTTINAIAHQEIGVQSLDSLPPEAVECMCHYINTTSWLQIVRITNIPNWYFERVVFPGQRLLFETPRWAKLEIYTAQLSSAIRKDKIPCEHLRVKE